MDKSNAEQFSKISEVPMKNLWELTRLIGMLLICSGCISGQLHLNDPSVLTAIVAIVCSDLGSSQP